MEKYYAHSDSNKPEPTDEFTHSNLSSFIIKINKYLLGLVNDERYHPSQTRGKSHCSNITIEDGPWSFKGKRHRGATPLVDKATISYRGREVWRITRKAEQLIPRADRGVQSCLRGVAENFDMNKPWSGPSLFLDKKTGFVYKATHSGTINDFFIKEFIYDTFGALVWQAVCEGGYI